MSKWFPTTTRPKVMGVLNVTPDSFYDGGQYASVDVAVARGVVMVREGADIIDVGGESTRPYSAPVSAHEEKARVLPVIRALARQVGTPISIDTTKASVAAAAIEAGATMVNDVSGLTKDPDMVRVVAEAGVELVIMHTKGDPQHMQDNPHYDDVVEEVRAFLVDGARRAAEAGVDPDKIWIDPGFGFGKNLDHNLDLLYQLEALVATGFPVMVGTSNKTMIGQALGLPVSDRHEGTAATVAAAVLAGAAGIRVHDVNAMRRVALMAHAIRSRGEQASSRVDRPILPDERVFLSLGSNVGDRLAVLKDGVSALNATDGVTVTKVSGVYETEAVGLVDQPAFLNLVVQLQTTLTPSRLLEACQAVESAFVRRRDVRWGPRTLDVDILLIGHRQIMTPRLTVPHREMHRRAFVLVPLAELAPDVGVRSRSVNDWLAWRSDDAHGVTLFAVTTDWIKSDGA